MTVEELLDVLKQMPLNLPVEIHTCYPGYDHNEECQQSAEWVEVVEGLKGKLVIISGE